MFSRMKVRVFKPFLKFLVNPQHTINLLWIGLSPKSEGSIDCLSTLHGQWPRYNVSEELRRRSDWKATYEAYRP